MIYENIRGEAKSELIWEEKSRHSGRELEKVICETITQDRESHDEFLDLFSQYEKADVERLDVSGNSVKKYVLVKSSYKWSGN